MAARLLMGGGAARARLGVVDPWTPWAIPRSVIAEWWSASDHGTALMTDDGSGLISNWKSRISGLAVTAATTARPTWAATSFNSAYPGLTFDGVANCFITTTLTTIPTGAVPGEIWVIGSNTNTAGLQVFVRYGQAAAVSRGIQAGSATNLLQATDGTTLIASAFNAAAPFVAMGNWSGTSENLFVNGTASSENPATIATLNTSTTRLRIGSATAASASLFLNGVASEFIILKALSTSLTLPGRTTTLYQDLMGWGANFYGFASSLPSNFPWRYSAP